MATVTHSSAPPARRTRGRPRSERRSAAVLAATLEELVVHGISNMTIEAIAARAGVSKVTIYRRWPDKIALTLAALETLPELAVPDTGSLLGDLRAVRASLLGAVASSPLGEVLPALMAERRRSEHHDAIGAYIAQRSRPFTIVVERAIARGELPASLDSELVALLFSSPLAMSLMNRDEPLDDDEWTAVVGVVVDGIRSRG